MNRIKKITYLTMLIFCVITMLSLKAYAQTRLLEITTYVPAPVGNYEVLKLEPMVEPVPCEGNILFVDSFDDNLKICQSGTSNPIGGLWSRDGVNFYPRDTSIKPNLKVGIGTTTPQAKLEIDGTAFFNTEDNNGFFLGNYPGVAPSPVLVVENDGPNTDAHIVQFRGVGINPLVGYPKVLIDGSSLSATYIEGKDPTTEEVGDGPLFLNVDNVGSAEDVYLVVGEGVVEGAQVGIGTVTPAGKLDVMGSLILSGAQDNTLIFLPLALPVGDDAALYRTGSGGVAYPYLNEGNLIIQPKTTSDADIVFATRNGAGTATTPVVAITKGVLGSGMIIDTDYNGSYDAPNEGLIVAGNVGIGTGSTALTHKLDVNGSMHLEPSSQPVGATGEMYVDSTTNRFRCYENSAWVDCFNRNVGNQVKSGIASGNCNGGNIDITFNKAFNSVPDIMITPVSSADANGMGAYVDWWVDNVTQSGATLHLESTAPFACSVLWIATDAGN